MSGGETSCSCFSNGRGKFDNPREEVVAAVRRCTSARILCTQLSSRCAADVPKRLSEHILPVFASGREGRRCCAGSIVISLDAPLEVIPSLEAHGSFVASHAQTALCQIDVSKD